MTSNDSKLKNTTEENLKNPQNISFKKSIGKTTYVVNAHFNEKVKEDIVTKIKSLITRL